LEDTLSTSYFDYSQTYVLNIQTYGIPAFFKSDFLSGYPYGLYNPLDVTSLSAAVLSNKQ